MGSFRLYFRYIGISLRSQMQYKLSFVMQTLGLFLVTSAEFVALAFLFERFERLQGWSFSEVALLYGVVNCSFALSEAFARGFDVFDRMLKTGGFDRVLLRPRGAAFQVLAQELQLMRIGRLAQGLMVLVWSMSATSIEWTFPKLMLLLWTILGGFCLFAGLFVLYAALSFFTTEGLELFNILTYGGVEVSQYPLSMYKPGFRLFFTFVVPLACVGYFPGLLLLERGEVSGWWALSPAAGVLFLGVCLLGWRAGVRRYTSTGS